MRFKAFGDANQRAQAVNHLLNIIWFDQTSLAPKSLWAYFNLEGLGSIWYRHQLFIYIYLCSTYGTYECYIAEQEWWLAVTVFGNPDGSYERIDREDYHLLCWS